VEAALTSQNDIVISRRVEEQLGLWFPIMMGIVDQSTMDRATAEEVQFYNELANKKYELTHGSEGMI